MSFSVNSDSQRLSRSTVVLARTTEEIPDSATDGTSSNAGFRLGGIRDAVADSDFAMAEAKERGEHYKA